MCSGCEKDDRNNRSVLYNSYYILLYIDYLLFVFVFYSKYHFFIIVSIEWVGGNESGAVFVKQRDELCIDVIPPPFTCPLIAAVMPNFCNRTCTHSSLFRSCPDVFFFLFFLPVKLKHVILLLNYYPFLCLKVTC